VGKEGNAETVRGPGAGTLGIYKGANSQIKNKTREYERVDWVRWGGGKLYVGRVRATHGEKGEGGGRAERNKGKECLRQEVQRVVHSGRTYCETRNKDRRLYPLNPRIQQTKPSDETSEGGE